MWVVYTKLCVLVYTTWVVYSKLRALVYTTPRGGWCSPSVLIHISDGALVLLGGCPATWPRQVERQFDREQVQEPRTTPKELVDEQNLRHRLWRKHGQGHNQESWRPRKRYRGAAVRWLRQIDRQLQLGIAFDGLSSFRSDHGPLWDSWYLWPYLSICSDQGSDGVSALFALSYHPDLKLKIA